MLKQTSLTMSIPVPCTTMCNPSTTIAGFALVITISRCSSRAIDSGRRPRDAVADQAGADRQQCNRKHGQDHTPGLDGQRDVVLLDHQAPVGLDRKSVV